ncbi:FAD-binding monooxygenase, partial [Streptomyces sp. TRM76130]|nr:FAD-binding monooxygenase [Streptomyces sp. TRM76130]
TWRDGVAHVGGLTVRHRGDTGHGIGRHRLREILAARARSLGVRLEYGCRVTADRPPAADLVVAADGVNSALRTRHAGQFGTEVRAGRNRYLWLGTTKVFDAFTFAFEATDHGWIWAYGYGFGPGHSTCVVECGPETWT